MKRIIFIALAVVTIGLTIYYHRIDDNKEYNVNIGVLPTLVSSLPHWVAVDKGFYKDEKIKVFEKNNNSSKFLVEALQRNDLDFLVGVSTTDVLNAFADNNNPLDAKIISHAQIKGSEPFEGLLVARGSTIINLKNLENKVIAVYPGGTAEATLKVFLSKKGIDIKTITFKEVAPPLHLDVLRSGDVDCSFTYEPMRTFCLENGKTNEIYSSIYASFCDPVAIGVTVLSNKIIQEKPEIKTKIINIWDKSIDFINNNPKEAKIILMKYLNLNEHTALNASWTYLTKTSEMNERVLENTINAYKEINVINQAFKYDKSILLKND